MNPESPPSAAPSRRSSGNPPPAAGGFLKILLIASAVLLIAAEVWCYRQLAIADQFLPKRRLFSGVSLRLVEKQAWAEDLVLAGFLMLPLLGLCGMLLFFKAFQLHRQKSISRLIAGNLVMLCFLLSFVPLAGEIYFRSFYDTTDSFGLMKVSLRWFDRHFESNRSGYRDSMDEYSLRPAAGKTRVTFVGDSFTAGHGVENVDDRFANLYRKMRPDVEVHCLAECGWETSNQVSALGEHFQSGYRTSLIVLCYCLNDLTDLVPGRDGFYERIFDSTPPLLCRHSFFLNTMYYWGYIARDPQLSNYYGVVQDQYSGPAFEQQAARLIQLKTDAEQHGARLVVVTFPMFHALGPDYQFQAAHERLDRFWKEHNVPHLDLLAAFASRNPRELVVNSHDAHPNVLAHRLAAEAIGAFLNEQLESLEQTAKRGAPP